MTFFIHEMYEFRQAKLLKSPIYQHDEAFIRKKKKMEEINTRQPKLAQYIQNGLYPGKIIDGKITPEQKITHRKIICET